MPLLSKEDYLATMGESREVLQPEQAAAVDLGRYLGGITAPDFQGLDFSARTFAYAWSIDGGAWQHILLRADVPNVFLVIVVNGRSGAVHGHFVLDLNREYGIEDVSPPAPPDRWPLRQPS